MNKSRADVSIAKKRHSAKLWRFPNVVGLGVGLKVTDGVPTKVWAIKVYVKKKMDIAPECADCIPSEVDGIPTDVEEQAPMRAQQ